MFFISVIIDAFYHPISSIYILISLWIGIKIFHGYWNIDSFAISYQDCIFKNQLWRLATTTFSHASILHLLYDIITIWTCRSLVNIYGYFFYLRYTILLLLFEPAITLVLIYIFGRINAAAANAHNANLILPSPSLQGSLMVDQRNNPFFMTKFSGSSGVLLAWLTYASIDSLTNPLFDKDEYNTYYLFGFFPISWVFAPILIALLLPMITNRNNAVANITGLTTGYLFIFGFLQILPDVFWTICFAVNGTLWILSHTVNTSVAVTTTVSTNTTSTGTYSSSLSTTAGTSSNNNNSNSSSTAISSSSLWYTPARSLFNATDEVYHVPCFNQYAPPPPSTTSNDDNENDIELNRIGMRRDKKDSSRRGGGGSGSSSDAGGHDGEDDSLLLSSSSSSSSGGGKVIKRKNKNSTTSSSSSSSSSSSLLSKMPLSTLLGKNTNNNSSSSSGQQSKQQQYTGLPSQDINEYDDDEENNDDEDDEGEEKKYDKYDDRHLPPV